MIGNNFVVCHYFCANCEDPLPNEAACEHCAQGTKVNYFLEIPLLNQLQSLFLRPGFYDSLLFRFQRAKKFQENLEDIYDAEVYQAEMQNGFLNERNNISFMWYTDGIAIFKSSNFSIWPMYLVINELSYKMRTQRQNIIVAGVWFGDKKPNPNIFLSPLHSELQRFQADGHLFELPDREPVLVKAKLLCL